MKNLRRLTVSIFTFLTLTASAQTDTVATTDNVNFGNIASDSLALNINNADTTYSQKESSLPQHSEYKLVANYNVVDGSYDFWTCTPPNYDTTCVNKKPLLVFLHGASLCGHDLSKVRRYGPINAISMGRKIDAVILAPQNHGGAWNPKKINSLVDWTIDNFNVDTTRIYVYGMSLGGYGTMDYCATYPERVAAGMAMCGGATADVSGLSKLPFWILHGTADRAVGINCSKEVVSKLQANNQDSLLMFTWLKGASHSALARIFYMDKTYDWLFGHTTADSVRTINRDCEITLNDISHAYNNIIRNSQRIAVRDPRPKNYTTSSSASLPDIKDCEVYVVRQGDVLVNIAKRAHTTVDNICRLNNISRNSMLHIGQKLRIRSK